VQDYTYGIIFFDKFALKYRHSTEIFDQILKFGVAVGTGADQAYTVALQGKKLLQYCGISRNFEL